MADDNNTQTAANESADKAKKPVNVIEGMDSRRMFSGNDSTTDAANYLNNASEKFADFDKVPQVINGVVTEGDDAGNFDSNVYTSDTRVMVAVLANRGEKGQPSTAKAIVVTPVPTFDAILASETGRAWAQKIIDKELNHLAVRVLRTADDLDSVRDQMPLTLEDYISNSRESSGGIMETYNSLFKGIIAGVAAKSPAWAKARLIKSELKKAFESRAYALEYYPQLEDRGDKPSMFVLALGLGQKEAKNQGLDPAIFDKWLATRNEKPLAAAKDDDSSDDFDLDDLAFVAGSEDNNTDAAATAEGAAAPASDSASAENGTADTNA